MENIQGTSKGSLLDLLNQIQSQYGLIVLILVLIICFGAVLFWNLTWKVWRAAMSAKEREITRLVKERDEFQRLIDRLLTSRVVSPKRDKAVRVGRKRSENA